MVNAIFFSNVAQATTLSGSISAGATTMTVGATTGFPGSFPYVLAVDYGAATEELVLVTAAAGTNLTATRAYGGTSAQSHSLGAVVRHVYDATEATAFRTHEAATAAVHGVAGTLVGTSDTQTLANKTLTSPTINAGALSGTFTGSPTLSGAPTFSGTVTHTGLIQSTQSASGNTTLASIVTADTFDRFRVYADGKQEWGSGAGARDVELFRETTDVLTTNDTFRVYRSTAAGDAFQARVTGDTISRLNVDADGTMSWGPGGASAQDVTLYRSSADVLKTDDKILSERPSVGGDCFAAKVVGDGGDRLLIDTDSTGAVVWFGSGASAPDTNLYRDSNNVLKTDGGMKFGGSITDNATGMVFKPYQDGTASVSLSAASFTTQTVTFPTAFASAPRVILTQRGSQSGTSALKVSVDSTTTTNFVLRTTDVNGNSQTVTTNVDWFAVSP
jgi:hypothetical protein